MCREDTPRLKEMPSAYPSLPSPANELSNLQIVMGTGVIVSQCLRDKLTSVSWVNTMFFLSSPDSHFLIAIVYHTRYDLGSRFDQIIKIICVHLGKRL